jgi:hypothetical protein
MTEKLKISYSKANTFLRCRKEYEWKYVEGLYAKGKSYPLKLGDIVHQLLHGFDKNELTLEDIQDYEKVIDIIKASYPDEEEDDLLQLTSQASALCAGYLHEHKDSDLTIIPGETMLEIDMGDYILVGIIDGWARPPDEKLFRLERKTSSRIDNYYLAGLRGGLQGAIYDHLTESLFQEKINGTIYDMLIKTKEPKFPRNFAKCDRTSMSLMLKTLEGVVRDINRGDFYPSTDCFRYNSECAYRKLCAFDSPGAREAFYTRRKEVPKVTKKIADDSAKS